ncbi:sphingomyelin phosphodiesterase 4-like isoform X2 [Biomphalaria glabrata]|uniref:Sphingomyelin phosphodiesterase 4-like isoform X2 n=1 Tax=Biomphalaria glabrata TaxID=6526 RepID=A0A9W2YG21_BIOGL|nr:sphingomyelin phosphodiesterase 4-like isoform X2 [Biomphalaria glabrata]
MASYIPLIEHLSASQNRPLHQRFRIMEEILRSTSLKELKASFPSIIHEIFDFEKEPNQGWQLDKLSKHHTPEVFSAIRSLLSPEGPLMKVVNYLHNDPAALYEFPIKYLPSPSRQMIESGAIPAFFLNKLQSQNLSSTVLLLNPFEYYMFHLAYALVNPVWRTVNHNWNDLHEYLYPTLIEDMLSYFLPCDKSSLPILPQFSNAAVRPILSQNQSRVFSKSLTQVSPSNASLSSSSHRSLFKSSFLNAQKIHMQNMPVYDQAETEIWRSETFLQVLIEFWLNQNSSGVNEIQSYACGVPEHFMPTMNHVKMVRLLVKYLHYFANSATLVVSSPYTHNIQSPLDQFKRSVIPHILQKKLYTFLKHAFAMWPLDSCFRMVLETWLSFIQPWRYKDISKGGILESHHSETDINKYVDQRWESFVEDNLLFYTVLTAEFIPRIYRMDLTSPYSAYMVFRVSKILSLPNLRDLIFKAESELFGNLSHPTDLGGSYLSGHNLFTSLLPSPILDLEGPHFQYQSFFSNQMKHSMVKVVNQLAEALEFVRDLQVKAPHSDTRSGFFSALFGFRDNSYSIYTSSDHKRLPGHLEQAIANFCDVFGIMKPVCMTSSTNLNQSDDPSIANESMYLTEPDKQYPECIATEFGLKLTDTGRKQLINKERRFDTFYVGDPDLQPVRSYENGTLVNILFRFCSFINSYFSSDLISLYSSPTFAGHFSRVFLKDPMSPEDLQRKIHSPISKSTTHLNFSHQPRISLRFLASYHTMVRLALAYFFMSFMLGTGLVPFLFLVLFLVMAYGLVVATYRMLTHSPPKLVQDPTNQ